MVYSKALRERGSGLGEHGKDLVQEALEWGKQLPEMCEIVLKKTVATPKKAGDLDQTWDDVEQLIMNSSEELQPARQIELDDYKEWFNERDTALHEFRICQVVDEWVMQNKPMVDAALRLAERYKARKEEYRRQVQAHARDTLDDFNAQLERSRATSTVG